MEKIKIVASFFVDVNRLSEAYSELGIEGLHDLLNAEFEVMEENGIQLDDWIKVDRHYDIRKMLHNQT